MLPALSFPRWAGLFALVLVAGSLVGLAGPSQPVRAQSASPDLVETAVGAGQFNTLARALQAAGLVETLKGPGPYTVFAPTDAAFAKLPPGTLDALLADRERLRAVLTYHVVPGKVTSAEVATLRSARTVQGESLAVSATGGSVKINNATVTQADIAASNGVIHVVDTVLLPPAMSQQALPKTGDAGFGLIPSVTLAAAALLLAGLSLRGRVLAVRR